MTDTPTPLPETATHAPKKPIKTWLELGPIIVFVALYSYLRRDNPDGAIYPAAIVFTILSVAALIYARVTSGRFSMPLVLGTVIIVISVGLAYIFQNPVFIYMKPTVLNTLFGVAVIGGVIFKKNIIQLLMGDVVAMPDKAWNTLAIRWGLFFFVLAIINEIVWRSYGEAFWVKFKLFGFFPLTLLFTLSQIPFMMSHMTNMQAESGQKDES